MQISRKRASRQRRERRLRAFSRSVFSLGMIFQVFLFLLFFLSTERINARGVLLKTLKVKSTSKRRRKLLSPLLPPSSKCILPPCSRASASLCRLSNASTLPPAQWRISMFRCPKSVVDPLFCSDFSCSPPTSTCRDNLLATITPSPFLSPSVLALVPSFILNFAQEKDDTSSFSSIVVRNGFNAKYTSLSVANRHISASRECNHSPSHKRASFRSAFRKCASFIPPSLGSSRVV